MLHSKWIRALSLGVVLALLAGCASVGPDYHPVQTSVPTSWPGISNSIVPPANFSAPPPTFPGTSATSPTTPITPAAPATTTTTTPDGKPAIMPPAGTVTPVSMTTTPVPVPAATFCTSGTPTENLAQWWTIFNDPILNQLVDDAITCNLDLRLAQLRIYQARENKGIIESNFFPTIDYTADAMKERGAGGSRGIVSSTGGGSGTGTTTVIGSRSNHTSNFFQHGLDAAWELDFFGGTRRNVESAQANIDAAVEDRRAVMVTIISEVGTNYITLRGLQKELDIARDNVVSQQKSVDLTDKKFKAGISNALDVANARALVATTRAQIPVLETSAAQMTYSIAVLLGKEPAALDALLNHTTPIPTPPVTIPLGLPSELLCRRPDIRRAQAQVHAANALIGVARADFFPKFSLTAQSGFNGPKPSSLATLSRRFYSFGPSVDWPIFAGGKIACNYMLQKTLTEQANVVFQQAVLVALQDVDNSVYAFVKEKEHRDALDDAVKAYQQVVNLSLKLYTDGSTDFLNVITAQRSLYQAQDDLAQSERALSVDVVAVYKALGGGWNEPGVIDCYPSARLVEASSSVPKTQP